jgi:hypothetical protein
MTPELERLLPADLQELVKQFGGYDKITPEVWAKYDEQLAATFEWLAAHHKVNGYDRVSDPLRGVWKMVPRNARRTNDVMQAANKKIRRAR